MFKERFRSIVNSYYRGANGVVLVYDITDPQSAQSIRNWLREIETYAGANIPIVLVGNKSDAIEKTDPVIVASSREIIGDIMQSYPEITHYECSAKLGDGVEDAFIGLVKKLVAQRTELYDPYASRSTRKGPKSGQVVQLQPDTGLTRYPCCS
jgi:Ras-related protein Rab-1A